MKSTRLAPDTENLWCQSFEDLDEKSYNEDAAHSDENKNNKED